jgi:RNA polymerase sigma factor (sigma-70 family)
VEPFDTVVAEHGAAVLRLCRSRLRSADADDAWSETFIAAMRAYPTLAAGSNVRGWLFTIAHHKTIDVLRRNGRKPVPVDHRVHDVPGGVTVPEPVDDGLRAALDALPPKQHDAVVLHHVAGLPYAEVGEIIGSSPAAARRSAADGIAALRAGYGRDLLEREPT